MKVPDYAAAAIAELLQELDQHRRLRPHAIRSWQEAYGLIAEEHHELLRQLTKSTLDDPKDDKLLNDACELAVMCVSAYIDMSAATGATRRRSQTSRDVQLRAGGYTVACTRCRKRQAFHHRTATHEFLCDRCAQAGAHV